MSKKKLHENHLNPTTFWDVDLNLLDSSKDRDFIIVRVLERGTDAEIQYIETAYSQQEIIASLESTKGVSKKTLNFYKTISL
ncbi:hypothetical protein SAMN05421636_11243 [Pricia antarctica]|uniref:DUF6922 domain-containing protein n=1 Tax=Pricia antarctica TaxID=641691 RepID=A0A1G7IIV7_9FLAO|nr:hypothetical protein [Pricia antarctica]SDF12508.1 hypothetical protein SAMN05421636_11243 [Pricia antarctica]